MIWKLMKYKMFRAIGWPKTLPMNLTIGLTYRCNSRCKTCNIYKKKAEELSTEELIKIFKSFGKNAKWVILSGGEPFLRKDIVEICKNLYKYCKPQVIVIPTNGILHPIIPKKVKEIVKACPKSRITINLSLDGVGEEHDKIRGVKCFDKAMKTYEGLKKIKAKNFELGVHSVISVFNYKNIPELYKFVTEKLKPDSYITEIAENRVELDTMSCKITPKYDQYSLAIDYLIKEMLKKKMDIKKMFRVEYYKNIKKILQTNKEVAPCYAGIASAQIAPDGEVWSCCIRAKGIGNLRDVDYNFKKIWYSKEADKERKYIKEHKCVCPLASSSYCNLMLSPKSILNIIWSKIKNLGK